MSSSQTPLPRSHLWQLDGWLAVLLLLLAVRVAALHRAPRGKRQGGLPLLPVQHTVPHIAVDVECWRVAVQLDVRHAEGSVETLGLWWDSMASKLLMHQLRLIHNRTHWHFGLSTTFCLVCFLLIVRISPLRPFFSQLCIWVTGARMVMWRK